MAGRSRRSWLSVLLGLVLGFTLASRLVLPRASELKNVGPRRRASLEGCKRRGGGGGGGGEGLLPNRDSRGALLWPPDPDQPRTQSSPSTNFLFVGVMTAQKYLETRAVAAYG